MAETSRENRMPERPFRGWWVMVLYVVIYILCTNLSIYFSQMLEIPSGSPGITPPWYFIRRDFIEGICMMFGAILCLTIGSLTWKSYKIYAGIGIWFTLLWYGPNIWKTFVISIRTDHLFDPTLARTSWADFKAYLNDPFIRVGQNVILVAVLLLGFLARRILGASTQSTSNA